MHKVSKGFGMISYNISDDPVEIKNSMDSVFEKPILLNINTIRKYWHAGAGIDDNDVYDRYLDEKSLNFGPVLWALTTTTTTTTTTIPGDPGLMSNAPRNEIFP